MVSKNQIKYVRSLQQRKFRQKYNKYAVEGPKIAGEALKTKPEDVHMVFALAEWLEENRSSLDHLDAEVTEASDRELAQISSLKSPNQVLLVLEQKDGQGPVLLEEDEWGLYLDGIQDPGNVGTIIRIADWFGWAKLILGPGSADLYNPKTIQATMGSFLRMDCRSESWVALKAAQPGIKWYGAVLDGKAIGPEDHFKPGWLVIGNESQGIQPSLLDELDHKISIGRGHDRKTGAESLNAAVATGILCSWLNS